MGRHAVTLILAIGCKDGVVIGSDSAVTDTASGTKQSGLKIRPLCDQPILYGASGDVGLIGKVADALEAFKPKKPLKQLRNVIKSLIVPELRSSTELHAPYPVPPFNRPPDAIFLFAGVLDGQSWILVIEQDGRDTLYDDFLGNFAAIGSGTPWAQALFRPNLATPRDLGVGKVLAHRVLSDSIDLAAHGLARPLHIYTISGNETISQVPITEMKALADTCDLWRAAERDSLGKVLSPQPNEEETELPKPK